MEFDEWIEDVRHALESINMDMTDWQRLATFDFEREYKAGLEPGIAAQKANRYWWRKQNEAIRQECTATTDCWLPRGHNGGCQSVE